MYVCMSFLYRWRRTLVAPLPPYSNGRFKKDCHVSRVRITDKEVHKYRSNPCYQYYDNNQSINQSIIIRRTYVKLFDHRCSSSSCCSSFSVCSSFTCRVRIRWWESRTTGSSSHSIPSNSSGWAFVCVSLYVCLCVTVGINLVVFVHCY
jgi:hypothetical protein